MKPEVIRPIYLHSATREFADTERLPERAYLGRALRVPGTLALVGCGCGARGLVRIRRAAWMRLVPGFRHYLCLCCGARVFRPRLRNRLGYGALCMQPVQRPLSA